MKRFVNFLRKSNSGNEKVAKELIALSECLKKAEEDKDDIRVLCLKKEIDKKRKHKIN
jgi:hypothetical protein